MGPAGGYGASASGETSEVRYRAPYRNSRIASVKTWSLSWSAKRRGQSGLGVEGRRRGGCRHVRRGEREAAHHNRPITKLWKDRLLLTSSSAASRLRLSVTQEPGPESPDVERARLREIESGLASSRGMNLVVRSPAPELRGTREPASAAACGSSR